ncbi:MAG: ABC transporter permease [Cyclobacteriaceae bacterium]
MILSLAWKNIWRSKRRSFVVIGAIIVGVWALIFQFSFYQSFIDGYSKNAIEHDYSHIQIHNEDYLLEPDLKSSIQQVEVLDKVLLDTNVFKTVSKRQIVNGMVASTKTSAGIQIYGIDPEGEQVATRLGDQLMEGTYFNKFKRNPILISNKIADKLKLKIRSKVVLTMQDIDGEITSASFRVEGIFESKSPRINMGVVYVRLDDLQRLTNYKGITEMAMMVEDPSNISLIKSSLATSGNIVRGFKEIAPEFSLLEEQTTMVKQIMTMIVMLALLFGIINTMLMAVLERTKEIGMLRSVGMRKGKVFGMIVWETVIMGVIAGPIGLMAGYLTNWRFAQVGLDLSSYAESLKQFGYDTIFYPAIEPSMYYELMLTVLITALLGALYPAYKAIQLNPLEAIRKL